MEAWEYPYEVRQARLSDDLSLAYVDEGQGDRVLLFIHGLGSYLKGWKKNIDALREKYRCIAIDLPGYGKSSKGNYPFHPQFFAGVIRDFMGQLSLNEVTVVGHSMGGQIAIHLALLPDVALSRLVLIAPAGFETFTLQDKLWINNMFRPDLLKSITYEQLVKNFDINFYRFPDDARFMISDRLLMQESNILFDQYCAMIPRCVRGMLEQPVFHRLNEIRQPVLILFGENDQLIPIKHLHPNGSPSTVAQAGAAQLRHSQLVLIQDCGHFVPWEQSEKVNSEIQRFVG